MVRFNEDEVRVMGRSASGVKMCIRDRVVLMKGEKIALKLY